jgi:hypothetical protein
MRSNKDRSTLANWVGGAVWCLEPLQARLAEHVFASQKLFADVPAAAERPPSASACAPQLKGARDRKSTLSGKKVEGRKSHAETHPELVALVRQLRRRRPKGWPKITARHLSRACGSRASQRARGAVLGGFDCVDACSAAASIHS